MSRSGAVARKSLQSLHRGKSCLVAMESVQPNELFRLECHDSFTGVIAKVRRVRRSPRDLCPLEGQKASRDGCFSLPSRGCRTRA